MRVPLAICGVSLVQLVGFQEFGWDVGRNLLDDLSIHGGVLGQLDVDLRPEVP